MGYFLHNILSYNEYNIEHNNVIVGKAGLTSTTHNNKRQLIITNFEIFEEFRNKLHGTQFIRRIIYNYKTKYDLIVCDVDVNNEKAIRFYERLGEVLKDTITEDNTYRVILYEKKY